METTPKKTALNTDFVNTLRVQVLGFGFSGLGLSLQDLGSRVSGSGSRV